jgi:hypothetical protein
MTERELFDFLKTNYLPDLELVKDKFSFYDCFSKESRLIIELKCRREHYDTLMLEKYKYNKLIQYSSQAEIRYISSTPKGIYSFNINELKDIKWTSGAMPMTTDFNRSQKIKKEFTMLNVDIANVLKIN